MYEVPLIMVILKLICKETDPMYSIVSYIEFFINIKLHLLQYQANLTRSCQNSVTKRNN